MEVCFFWHWEWKLMNASFQLVLMDGIVNSSAKYSRHCYV